MEKDSPETRMKDRRGMENISNLFLSTRHKAKENFQQAQDQYEARDQHDGDDRYEVEEMVTVCKKFAFQDNENVQQNMIRTLSRHIEEGYHIMRVDLQKNEDISKPSGRIRREEEVVIFIKAPVSA
jgi:hypothetical protein